MPGDLSLMSLWLAGEAGQVSLARSGDSAGLRAVVDQHAAEVRDALGDRVSAGSLMSYARGFVDAAVARGWWPPHRKAPDVLRVDLLPDLDWESLRLAAVCRLYTELLDRLPTGETFRIGDITPPKPRGLLPRYGKLPRCGEDARA